MTTQISSDKIKKWYKHTIWSLRNRTFVLWFRAFPLIFVVIIAGVIAWLIIAWYQLFYTMVLTSAQIDEVRAQNAMITFQKEQFRDQITNQQTRREFILRSQSLELPDIFYPTNYLRKTKF